MSFTAQLFSRKTEMIDKCICMRTEVISHISELAYVCMGYELLCVEILYCIFNALEITLNLYGANPKYAVLGN